MELMLMVAGVLAAGGLVLAICVRAETVLGEIKEIDSRFDCMMIDRVDPKSGRTEEIKVTVDDMTEFDGARYLGEFRIGNAVIVEADHNTWTHRWKAKLVQLAGVPAGI